jgi:permuted papain-like amidase YaeF/Yiix C92 family enzyme
LQNSRASTLGDSRSARFKFGSGLCPGDIILSTVPKSGVSSAIRIATRSLFSHAAIYRGEMNVIEAIGVGVTNYSIARRGVRDKANVRILRLGAQVDNHEAITQLAVEAVESYRGRGYWVKGAMQSLVGNNGEDKIGRLFCSYFVAQVYEDAGLLLCPGIAPCDVTPADLLGSPFLINQTEHALVLIPDWQLEAPLEAIDSEQAASPVHKLLAQERELLDKVVSLLQDAGLRAPRTFDDLLRILLVEASSDLQADLDSKVCRALEDSGFGRLIDAVAAQNPALDTSKEFPIDPTQMPISGLRATIELYRQLQRKLSDRFKTLEDEVDAGLELCEVTQLHICKLFLQRTTVKMQVLRDGLMYLAATIEELENVYQERTEREAANSGLPADA